MTTTRHRKRNRLSHVEVTRRRAAALRLRQEGAGWRDIADELGYASAGAASKDVARSCQVASQPYPDRPVRAPVRRNPHPIGQTFGRLTVEQVHDDAGLRPVYRCRCACGKTTHVRGDQLTTGRTQSCGCLHRGLAAQRVGPQSPTWKGIDAAYSTAHKRIKRARGRAAQYPCSDCGQPAEEWSFINPNCASARTGPAGTKPNASLPSVLVCSHAPDLLRPPLRPLPPTPRPGANSAYGTKSRRAGLPSASREGLRLARLAAAGFGARQCVRRRWDSVRLSDRKCASLRVDGCASARPEAESLRRPVHLDHVGQWRIRRAAARANVTRPRSVTAREVVTRAGDPWHSAGTSTVWQTQNANGIGGFSLSGHRLHTCRQVAAGKRKCSSHDPDM